MQTTSDERNKSSEPTNIGLSINIADFEGGRSSRIIQGIDINHVSRNAGIFFSSLADTNCRNRRLPEENRIMRDCWRRLLREELEGSAYGQPYFPFDVVKSRIQVDSFERFHDQSDDRSCAERGSIWTVQRTGTDFTSNIPLNWSAICGLRVLQTVHDQRS